LLSNSARGIGSVSIGHTMDVDVGWVRKGSRPRVVAVLRNLVIDLCALSVV
jgi:hypothetical protein